GGCTQQLKKVKDDAKTGQPRYEVLKTPCFEDEEDNVRRGAWVTWLSEAEAKKIDLQDGRCRVPPKQKYPSARIKAIEVARFHGMNRPEPYAMGAAAGKPPVHIPEVETTEIPAGEEATPEKVKKPSRWSRRRRSQRSRS